MDGVGKAREKIVTMQKLYVILFTHKHGADTWPHFSVTKPSEDEVIAELRETGQWDEDDDERGSTIEVRGPVPMPEEGKEASEES